MIVFKTHFDGFINLARIRLICHIITALCKVRSVNFSKLSFGFDTDATGDSNYKRIQRFMASPKMPMETHSIGIFTLIPFKGPY
ncbi:hypothetical protein [Galbibacter sp.]|uniref:hypothetical protein n=1 Tax=Galbibacter sp. TaxID=2918471 RepID=UPI003A94DACB